MRYRFVYACVAPLVHQEFSSKEARVKEISNYILALILANSQ